jgi:hypothetical protein
LYKELSKTDANGSVTQHVEYVPFGEVFVEERNSNWSTPYLFNGKERDAETGLSYSDKKN